MSENREGGLFTRLRRKYWDTHLSYIPQKKVVADEDEEIIEPIQTSNIMENPTTINSDKNGSINYRKEIDDFLNRGDDFEKQGYQDALNEPDTSNMKTYGERLKSQFEIITERVITNYSNDIERNKDKVKIATDNGMLDNATMVKTEIEISLKEIKRIQDMLNEARQNKGNGHIIILAYEQGFKKGLAAKLFGRI